MFPNPRFHTRRAMLGLISSATVGLATSVRAATQPIINVWKDPSCGCCTGWVEHLRRNDFTVTVVETADMQAVKTRLGVPVELASCSAGTNVLAGPLDDSALFSLSNTCIPCARDVGIGRVGRLCDPGIDGAG